jgi:hypothetical protein
MIAILEAFITLSVMLCGAQRTQKAATYFTACRHEGTIITHSLDLLCARAGAAIMAFRT